MDFYEVLEQVLVLLQRHGRVSYRAVKRQFDLDDETLDDLKEELLYAHSVADDEDRGLIWTGDAGQKPAPTRGPTEQTTTDQERDPASYTPSYLAEKIFTSRSALEGERKQVTVMFCDIKDSTELIRDLDPEAAQQLLDPAIHIMMDAVHRFEGTVNQVLGDGIMALFGAPVAHEDHAARACYAALAMQSAMQTRTKEVRQSHGLTLRIRVGLNAGEVVVRTIGNDLHMDYSAVGPTTHLAARMEQLADPGSIVLTASTLRLVEGLVRVNALGAVPVKGMCEPIEVYELTGASTIRRRLQAAVARGLTKFVGRDTEIEALVQALERAKDGNGQVVAGVGEAGLGKSRLFYEFTQSHRTQGWRVLENSSVSYGKATPYFPVIDLLKRYVHVEEGDDPRTIRAKVTGQILTLDESFQETIPALLFLLDVLPEDSPFLQLDPPQRRQRTLDGLKRILLRESQVQPLLLVFEDLHWIDSETQALLDSLVESLPTSRLLLLVNYRPEYQHSWGNKTYYTQLRLGPLQVGSAKAFLVALLGDDPSLDGLKALLIERTQANPFFLEEMIRTLMETGALEGEPGGHRLVSQLPSILVPDTVQAILAARIDRLPADEKQLLQTAAVIGTDIPLSLLQGIIELPEEMLHRGLTRLQAAEFLYETSLFPERVYTFKHTLTHEVAYSSLLQQRRRILHTRIVEALERGDSERFDKQVEQLARHALQGEMWDRVLRYAYQAGIRAANRSAYALAGGYFDHAIEALAHLPEDRDMLSQGIELHLSRAASYYVVGDHQQQLSCNEAALRLAENLGEPYLLARALTSVANALWRLGDNVQALKLAERGLAVAETTGDITRLVPMALDVGMICHTMGDFRRGSSVLAKAVAWLPDDLISQRWDRALYPAVATRSWLARCLAELGEFKRAFAIAEEGLHIANALQQPASLCQAYQTVSFVLLRQGKFQDAIPWCERSMALMNAHSMVAWYSGEAGRLGYVYAMSGRQEEAIPLLEQAVERLQSVDAIVYLYLAEIYLRTGRHHDIGTLVTRALNLCRERSMRGVEALALWMLGEVATRHGSSESPETRYQQAIALADELGMRPLQAHCHRGLGTLYRQIGQLEQARAELSTAIEMYRAMEMTFWLPETEGAQAQLGDNHDV